MIYYTVNWKQANTRMSTVLIKISCPKTNAGAYYKPTKTMLMSNSGVSLLKQLDIVCFVWLNESHILQHIITTIGQITHTHRDTGVAIYQVLRQAQFKSITIVI